MVISPGSPVAQMIEALEVVARLCAIGLGLEADAITSLMHEGPHLLAPTGEQTSNEAKARRGATCL